MRISEAILKYLKIHGVNYIFGVPAGTVSPIFDAMNDIDIMPVIAKNEAGAAYSAARFSCISRKLGVCIGAGGVGVCNMVNGIADAKRSKAPVLVISGFVHRWQIGKGAIQEQDAVDIFKPITKYSEMVLEPERVIDELEKAVQIACTPPCGPVFLCIPVDVQASEYIGDICSRKEIPESVFARIDDSLIDKAVEIIERENYGIILAGKGCRGFSEEIMRLSEYLQWPVMTTPNGKGVIPADFELNLGNYGFTSSDLAEEYVEKGPATCLIAVGTSLGETSTCNFSKSLFSGRKIIHIDQDAKELGKVFETDIKIRGDLGRVIPEIARKIKKTRKLFLKPQPKELIEGTTNGLSLKVFFKKIHSVLPSNVCYMCDIGSFMTFALKYLEIPRNSEFELNVDYGAMGSAIGGAPGACFADPGKRVVVFAGDGCFFMNGMEVLTAKEYNLPIVYFIINNSMLGYVENGHKYIYGRSLKYFSHKYIPISEMSRCMGIPSLSVYNNEDIASIGDFVKKQEGPCIIEIVVDGKEPAPIIGRLKALKSFSESG